MRRVGGERIEHVGERHDDETECVNRSSSDFVGRCADHTRCDQKHDFIKRGEITAEPTLLAERHVQYGIEQVGLQIADQRHQTDGEKRGDQQRDEMRPADAGHEFPRSDA